MDSAQIGVFHERSNVCLTSFLKSVAGRGLEAQIGPEVLRALLTLVAADLAKGDGAWKGRQQEK